jgi:hypothetical protein
MNKQLENLLFELDFYANYHREKQLTRFNAHLDEGKTIASFLYNELERNIDEHIALLRRAHTALTEIVEEKPKPFWHHILKK